MLTCSGIIDGTNFISLQVGKPNIVGPVVFMTWKGYLLPMPLCESVNIHVPYCPITCPPNAVILIFEGVKSTGWPL